MASGPSARRITDELVRRRVTHVVGLPDNTSKALYERLDEEPAIRVVTVTREGEAFAIASGLWAAGACPVVLIQNTGLLESGDAIRGTAVRMAIPLVCLVTYRGYAGLMALPAGERERITGAPDAATLARPDLDSTAVVTEATLRAWGLSFDFLHDDADLPLLAAAFEEAAQREGPVVRLLTRDTT